MKTITKSENTLLWKFLSYSCDPENIRDSCQLKTKIILSFLVCCCVPLSVFSGVLLALAAPIYFITGVIILDKMFVIISFMVWVAAILLFATYCGGKLYEKVNSKIDIVTEMAPLKLAYNSWKDKYCAEVKFKDDTWER